MKPSVINAQSRHSRGVPAINHGFIDRDPAELFPEFLLTATAYLEVHCADGVVLARVADQLPELVADAALRGVDARLVGLTAENHRLSLALPVRNIYGDILVDSAGPDGAPHLRKRLFSPPLFAKRLRDGLAPTFDPALCSHRLAEIDAVLAGMKEGGAARYLRGFRAVALQATLHDPELMPISPLPCPTAHLTSRPVAEQLGLEP